MKILAPRYYGMIARCNSCGCLIGYEPQDVNNEQRLSCPQCNFNIWVPLNLNYDGVVKEDELDSEPTVECNTDKHDSNI